MTNRPLTNFLFAVALFCAISIGSSSAQIVDQLEKSGGGQASQPDAPESTAAERAQKEASDSANIPQSTSLTGSVRGLWRVQWQDWPKEGETTSGDLLVRNSGEEIICVAGQCGYRAVREGGWSLAVSLWGYEGYTPAQPRTINRFKPRAISPAGVEFSYTFGPPHTQLRLAGSDALRGSWKKGTKGGTVTARRIAPQINRIAAWSGDAVHEAAPGRPVLVRKKYKATSWGAGNDMLGNRPTFHIDIYGSQFRQLWNNWPNAWIDKEQTGLEVVGVKALDGGSREIPDGFRFQVAIWPNVTPGIHTLFFHGMAVPIYLEVGDYPDQAALTALEVLNEAGTAIKNIAAGAPFRLRGTYDGDKKEATVIATLYGARLAQIDGTASLAAAGGTSPDTTIELSQTNDPSVYLSKPLVLASDAAAPDEVDQNWIASEDKAAGPAILAQHAGNWTVTHEPASGAEAVLGSAVIAADGGSVTVTLPHPDKTKRYSSIEVGADEIDEEEAAAFLAEDGKEMPVALFAKMRLRETGASIVASDIPLNARLLTLGSRPSELRFVLSGLAELPAVTWPKTEDLRIALQMRRDTPGAFTGDMREDKRNGSRIGRQTWSRAPTIAGVRVLEDQASTQTMVESQETTAYPYPKTDKPGPRGAKTRTLFVFGKHLPTSLLAQKTAVLESGDASVGYSFTPGKTADLIERGREKLKNEPARASSQEEHDAVILTATLQEDVAAGSKRLILNGADGAWPLQFNDATADLRFVREDESAKPSQHEQGVGRALFFPNDTAYLELDLHENMPLDPPVLTIAKERAKPMGRITLKQDPDDDTIWRSDAIHLRATLEDDFDEKGPRIQVDAGDVLIARPLDPASVLLAEGAGEATIGRPRTDDETLWTATLRRVATCREEDPEAKALHDGSYAKETAIEDSAFIVSNLDALVNDGSDVTAGDRQVSRSVTLSKGDHAAGILFRDSFVRLMNTRAIPRFRNLAFNSGRIAEIREKARRGGASLFPDMWNEEISFEDPEEGFFNVSMTLGETLNPGTLAEKTGLSPKRAEAWAIVHTRISLERRLDLMRKAAAQAEGATCNPKFLLAIAGARNLPMLPDILPKLVKQEGEGAKRVWRPDLFARQYVSGLPSKSAEVEALKAYAVLDDAVVVTALTILAPVSRIASAATLGGDAYFGAQGVNRYFEADDFYEFARGASPLLGSDFEEAAKARLENGVMTTVGVIAPGLVAGGAAASQLRNLQTIDDGRRLMRGKGATFNSLDELNEVERTAAASYYTDMVTRADRNGFSTLPLADQKALRKLDDIATQKGAPSIFKKSSGSASDPNGPYIGFEERMGPDFARALDDVPDGARAAGGGGGVDPSAVTGRGRANELGSDLIGAPDSPYRELQQSPFSSRKEHTGHLLGDTDYSGNFDNGLRIVDQTSGQQIRVGKKLGGGAYSKVYENAGNPGEIIKQRAVYTDDFESIENIIHDSEVGRNLVSSAKTKNSVFDVVERVGEPVWVKDPTPGIAGHFVTREKNISETINGQVVTNAKQRFKARGTPPTREEALTMNLAVRQLNQKGIVWTDNKFSNLDVVRDATSPTGHRAVFFDFDGFRPVKGATDAERWRNARDVQELIDEGANGGIGHLMIGARLEERQPFDYRAFGRKMSTPMTKGKNKTGEQYTQFNGMTPEDFRAAAEAMARERGSIIPYNPPTGE